MTISAPSRCDQIVSCSTAAARNVSPAPSSTLFPSALNIAASLAIEVVLPAPLTPQTMITVGPLAANRIGEASCFISSPSFAFQVRDDVLQLHDAAAEVLGDLGHNLLGRDEAHVGLEQDRPHLVEKLVVDQPPLALEEVADVGVENLDGLGETALEFVEQAHGRC